MSAQTSAAERLAPKGWEVIAALAMVLVIAIGGFALYIWVAAPSDLSHVSVATTMAIQGAALSCALTPLVIRHRTNVLRAIGLVSASPRSIAIWAIALVSISFALDQALIPISQLWDESSDPLWAVAAIEEGLRQSGLAITLLVIAIITPLGEEVFFRGILFGWLRNRIRLQWAVPLQAILFGALHVEIVHILTATGTGVGLALAREHSRSLWPAIGAHCLINAVAVIDTYLRLDGSASG